MHVTKQKGALSTLTPIHGILLQNRIGQQISDLCHKKWAKSSNFGMESIQPFTFHVFGTILAVSV